MLLIIRGWQAELRREILKLIEVWVDDTIQAQLQECTQNLKVFEKVARVLNEAGYERGHFSSAMIKLKNLRESIKK